MRSAMSLMLRMIFVTSSRTPGIEENSCSTPSMCTVLIAAPCSDDSNTRRSAFPSVIPNPRSSGSATNFPYPPSLEGSELTCFGMVRFFHFIRRSLPVGWRESLRIELDDELFVDRGGNRVASRNVQHASRHRVGAQVQPFRRAGPLARLDRAL